MGCEARADEIMSSSEVLNSSFTEEYTQAPYELLSGLVSSLRSILAHSLLPVPTLARSCLERSTTVETNVIVYGMPVGKMGEFRETPHRT